MQFIFGDDRSKYDIIYTDTDKESAMKLYNERLSFPFSPDAFDVHGYVAFGPNSNQGIFFKCCKDRTLINRNIYYVHGVNQILSAEYFNSEYLKRMFFKFADQNSVDAVREDAASFIPKDDYSEELVALPDDAVAVDHEILKDIIAKLYQKKRIIIALSDDQFVNENVLLLLKKIFSYLTPSLRKVTTYLIGMLNAGNFENEILIKVVPKSMLRNERVSYIDLQDETFKCKESLPYAELAEYLISANEQTKDAVFAGYEDICKCLKTVYKNHKFMEYFNMICSGSVDACDTLMDSYVLDDNYDENSPIPEMFAAALTELYSNHDFCEKKFDFNQFRLSSFKDFYNQNYCTIEKMFLLAPESLSVIDKNIFTKLSSIVISAGTIQRIQDEISKYTEQRNNAAGFPRSYEMIAQYTDKSVELLKERIELLNDRRGVIVSRVHGDIVNNAVDVAILDNVKVCCEYYKNQFSQLIADTSAHRVQLEEVIYDVVKNELDLYNKEKQAEIANQLREREEKKNLEELSKVFAKHSELCKHINESELDSFKASLKDVEAYPEKYSELFAPFYADYIVIMCRKNGIEKFFKKNNLTVLSTIDENTNKHMYECVRDKLLVSNPDIAFMFIAKYAMSLADAVKQIVFAVLANSGAIDSLNSDIFKDCCEMINSLLRNRQLNGENVSIDKSDADYSKIENKIDHLDKKGNSMMVLAEISPYVPFDVNYSKGIKKGIIAVLIISIVVAVIAAGCAVYFLMQKDSGDTNVDDGTGYSEEYDDGQSDGDESATE